MDEIATWEPEEPIIIKASTGAGKSHFIKYPLRKYLSKRGQKCLYLLSRLYPKEQFIKELPQSDTIHFTTYQAVENMVCKSRDELSGYDFIVCDECHYFTEDCKFNSRTDISLEWILSQTQAVRIFMSATSGSLEKYFNEQRIEYHTYEFLGNYENIKSLTFFFQEEQLDLLANKVIDSGNRGVFFIQSAKRAYELYERYKDKGAFLCSRNNKEYAKYIDSDFVRQLLETEKFECILLFTTTALDTGFNLKDETLAHVVVDVSEPDVILQCLGRKRYLGKYDCIDLYIRARSNKQIKGYIRSLQDDLDKVHQFQEHGAVQYNNNYERRNDNSGMIIDVPENREPMTVEQKFYKKIHGLKYAQTRYNIETFQKILSLGDFGFIEYISGLLGKEYIVLEKMQKVQSLSEYLDSIVGVLMYTPKDRLELIERFNIRQDGYLCRGYDAISGWLKSSNLPYRLETFRKTMMIDGKKQNFKSVWVVVRLDKE